MLPPLLVLRMQTWVKVSELAKAEAAAAVAARAALADTVNLGDGITFKDATI